MGVAPSNSRSPPPEVPEAASTIDRGGDTAHRAVVPAGANRPYIAAIHGSTRAVDVLLIPARSGPPDPQGADAGWRRGCDRSARPGGLRVEVAGDVVAAAVHIAHRRQPARQIVGGDLYGLVLGRREVHLAAGDLVAVPVPGSHHTDRGPFGGVAGEFDRAAHRVVVDGLVADHRRLQVVRAHHPVGAVGQQSAEHEHDRDQHVHDGLAGPGRQAGLLVAGRGGRGGGSARGVVGVHLDSFPTMRRAVRPVTDGRSVRSADGAGSAAGTRLGSDRCRSRAGAAPPPRIDLVRRGPSSNFEVSEQLSSYRLMAVHAHPDDESSKGAATMARYVDEGHQVLVVTLTGGERGDILNPAMDTEGALEQLPQLRIGEMARAAEILGVDHVWLGFEDSGLPQGDPPPPLPEGCFAVVPMDEPVRRLVEQIRTFRPHVMITYDENGGYPHPDHIRCHEVSMAAYDAAADPDYHPELGEPWEISKVYYSHGFIR